MELATLGSQSTPQALRSGLPWAFVGGAVDGAVTAVASLGLPSGIFYCWLPSEPNRLTVGLDPRSVMEAHGGRASLNPEFVLGFLVGDLEISATPLRQVARVPMGDFLRWPAGRAPVVGSWWRLPDPADRDSLRGRAAHRAYVDAFGTAIRELTAVPGPLVAELSGGLDSTFVVATMARTNPERPIRALTHVPSPEALLTERSGFDADDSPWARRLALAHPDQVTLELLHNAEGVSPLTAAQRANERSWWPVLNPGNHVWMDQLRQRARTLGAHALFSGSSGNVAFSHPHPYALADALRHGHLGRSARAVSLLIRGRVPLRTAARLPSRTTQARGPDPSRASFLSDLPPASRRSSERDRFLAALTGRTRPHVAALNPRLTRGLFVIDPFLAPGVLEVAACIDPVEWWNGPWPRGFARTLSAGRVPDDVRGRRRRGDQAADSWWHARHEMRRYVTQTRLLAETPVLAAAVDQAQLESVVTSWPWGSSTHTPRPHEFNRVNQILNLAGLVRHLTQTPAGRMA